LTTHDILPAIALISQDAKGRCGDHIEGISAWAAAHAVADEVEVPCREVGLTILDFRL
jgi:hypothetical protein